MSTTTVTSIRLTELPAATTIRATGSYYPSAPHSRTGGNNNNSNSDSRRQPSPDELLEESRLVDSTAPDGGYGWVIVASGAVLLWWSVGATYAWGVMQKALADRGLSGPATLSFVGSLGAALVSVFAIANAWLVRRVGARRTGMLGVALMSASEILSGFAVKNVGALFFTSGFLFGAGSRYEFEY